MLKESEWRYDMLLSEFELSGVESRTDQLQIYYEGGYVVWTDKELGVELFLTNAEIVELTVFVCRVLGGGALDDLTVHDTAEFGLWFTIEHVEGDSFWMTGMNADNSLERERHLDREEFRTIANVLSHALAHLELDYRLLNLTPSDIKKGPRPSRRPISRAKW